MENIENSTETKITRAPSKGCCLARYACILPDKSAFIFSTFKELSVHIDLSETTVKRLYYIYKKKDRTHRDNYILYKHNDKIIDLFKNITITKILIDKPLVVEEGCYIIVDCTESYDNKNLNYKMLLWAY
jgi:hypothetical protein